MRLFLTTTAALAVTAIGAFAAEHMSTTRSDMQKSTAMTAMTTAELNQAEGGLIRTRDITGGAIYSMTEAQDADWDPNVMHDSVAPNWNQIGEIEDVVLSPDGQMTGIVAEVGGFLDVGDKHVLISVTDVNLVSVDDETYAYVTRFNEDELMGMPNVDEGFWN